MFFYQTYYYNTHTYDHHQRKIIAFRKYTQQFEINVTCQLHTIHTQTTNVLILLLLFYFCIFQVRMSSIYSHQRTRSVGGNVLLDMKIKRSMLNVPLSYVNRFLPFL